MRQALFVFLLVVLGSCNEYIIGKDPSNTHLAIFEEFWKGVDANWPEFANKNVNWDSLYNLYKPQAEAVRTDAELKKVLTPLILSLKDGHTTIYVHNDYKNTISYTPLFPKNFYGFDWISRNYIPRYKTNGVIAYSLVNQEVGYIYIGTFTFQQGKYELIDQILQEFSSVKAIIIDVRSNSGGNSLNSDLIASRFADDKHTFSYRRSRLSAERTLMSDFIAQDIAPAGKTQFKGKVAILTNRYSASSTEDFVLAMKAFPNVIQIGDNSWGLSGTNPIQKELPMGWSYRVSRHLLCDLTKQPITRGIAPDILVQTTKADSLNGKDTIIERAISELLR